MRLLHTSDWHLGHTLHDHSRELEHERFLEWLLGTLDSERVDALVVAGDVFDSSNPPASAQAAYYRFLGTARARMPHLGIVVIGGNHDSPGRLDAPRDILDSFGVHVVGGMAKDRDVVFPLRDASGDTRAWVAALPFLRIADVPAAAEDADPLVAGVRRAYAQALDAARARREPGQALITTGHCYMTGTTLSEGSERKILGGNQHPLPVDVFPDDLAYAALGHLHLAQDVGGRRGVRYSGSPIPLSMGEAGYPHQALLVDLDGERLSSVTTVRIPRSVDMLRLPRDGPATPDDVLALLHDLPPRADDHRKSWPFLEVSVLLPSPDPGLRQRLDAVLETKAVRLVAIRTHYTGHGRALADKIPTVTLKELSPESVFLQRYQKDHQGDPPEALLGAFHELLETV